MLQRAAAAAGLVHVAFCVLFFALGTPLMGWANVGAVGLYAAAWALLRARRNRLATTLMLGEIVLHALVATRVLGWDSGFHYYVLLLVPMVFVSPGRTLRLKLTLGLALVLYYAGLDRYARLHPPLDLIHSVGLDSVRYFNIAATLGLLAYLAHIYVRTMQRAERRLRDLATTDALTGLANRRRALAVAADHLARRRRDGSPLSFILGDVDHFKAINDLHGHDAGDRVLAAVADVLRAATRETDIASRWGGEEFLVVLPDTPLPAALQVAERVREALGHVVVGGLNAPLAPSATLGVSTLREGESVEAAIGRADAAMYQGKLAGRNRCVADPDTPSAAPLAPAAAHAQG